MNTPDFGVVASSLRILFKFCNYNLKSWYYYSTDLAVHNPQIRSLVLVLPISGHLITEPAIRLNGLAYIDGSRAVVV